MHRHSGSARLIAPLAATVALVAACSGGGSVQQGGAQIQNADELIEQADTAFGAVVKAGVDTATTTVSEESRCYFLRLDEDDNVDPNVYCGPVRTLGGADDESWYALPTESVDDPEEGRLLHLLPVDDAELGAVDVSQLFRPDGAEPIDVSAIEEPQAPEAPVSDFAILVEAANLDVPADFIDLDEPYRLVTPSAALTVTAAAELEAVPAELVSLAGAGIGGDLQEEEEGETASVPFYRPADGQQVRAWRVTIGAPPEIGPSLDRGFLTGEAEGRDASTSYALGAGSQRLSITGALTGDDGGSANIPCEEVQCEERDQVQYVLVSSGSADAAPSLIATVDGTDQSLNLDTGELASDVTQVSYTREQNYQQVSTTWSTQTMHLADEEEICEYCDPVDYNFGGAVQRAYLAPFAAKKGWAPAGKAWLLVPIDDDPAGLQEEYLGSSTFAESNVDYTKSWTLDAGGEVMSHDPDATIGHTAAFLVNDTFTEGTFTYQPTGSITYTDPDRTEPFEAKEPLTLDITFP